VKVDRVARGPLVVLGLTLIAWACASAPAALVGRSAGQVAVAQYLYRLTYDGGGGRISLRVVLRTTDSERFQMAVSDITGRQVWGLDFQSGRSVLVDHREKIFCVSGSGLRLDAVHPQELPLEALPRVLAGEPPVDPGAPVEEFEDAAGRRWRLSYEAEELSSWSLVTDDGPTLWWIRQTDGGILSRRGGEQYRWTTLVVEPSTQPIRDIIPDGYAEGVCSD
jgi:hypothetical protein